MSDIQDTKPSAAGVSEIRLTARKPNTCSFRTRKPTSL
jgi:hypothetical protein